MTIRDRIKDFRRVKGRDLLPNPRNWRRHPQAQRDAMRAVLEEVGFAGAALARETPAGLMLIDGHLRAELEPDAELPVLVLDVDEAEAAKLLATYDPLGKMAEPDPDALGKLLAEIDTESEALRAMLEELAEVEASVIAEEEPSDSICENFAELLSIQQQRKQGNANTAQKNDTERYLVVVYPTRESRELAVKKLGLPKDERYVSSVDVRVSRCLSGRAAQPIGLPTAASSKNSGATG